MCNCKKSVFHQKLFVGDSCSVTPSAKTCNKKLALTRSFYEWSMIKGSFNTIQKFRYFPNADPHEQPFLRGLVRLNIVLTVYVPAIQSFKCVRDVPYLFQN